MTRKHSALIFALVIMAAMLMSGAGTVYAFNSLEKGSRGEEVKEIQIRLIEMGYLEGDADGLFGPVTEAAVIAFQGDNNLEPTGIVNEDTYNAIMENAGTERESAEVQEAMYPRSMTEWLDNNGIEISQDIFDILKKFDICIYYAENYKNFPDIDLPMPETVVSSMPGSEEVLYKGEDAYAYGFSSPEEFQAYLTAYLSMLSVEGYSFTTDKGRTTFEGGHELVSLAYEDGSVQWIFIKD